MGNRHLCAAASGVRDGGRSPAIGVQAQVANHCKRLGSKALVVSVTEKASEKVSGMNQRRRTTVNHRSSVESVEMTSKLRRDVASGLVWREPVYWPDGVRHRGGVILVWALAMNCGNLRWRCKGKGTSVRNEAENTEAPSRDGVICSSEESLVMRLERRDHVIQSNGKVNCASRRNISG